MLRLMIGTGVLLMTVGFGAAGWQYWQSLPTSPAAEAGVEAASQGAAVAGDASDNDPLSQRQSWLISPTGGLVQQDEVRAYLAQERFVPDRRVVVVRQANLSDLLAEGEKLPEPAFLEVLADIRAPKVAEGLCGVLLETVAQDCALNAARVVENSIDQADGTAEFQLELVFRLRDDGVELPDLAAHVFTTESVTLLIEPGAEGSESAETALRAILDELALSCAGEAVGEICRPLALSVRWTPGEAVRGTGRIGWLAPLPEGMFVAPPLEAAQGG